jgi:hypothetical protein
MEYKDIKLSLAKILAEVIVWSDDDIKKHIDKDGNLCQYHLTTVQNALTDIKVLLETGKCRINTVQIKEV